jgi:NAD(P)-dependent dehydrogenase (short-subunit alcohol dehydrogenase family)
MMAAERGVAVVTGATGGMGRVLALALARRGLHVVAIARDPRRAGDLRAAVAAGGGSLEVVAGDLSHRDGIVAVTNATRERTTPSDGSRSTASRCTSRSTSSRRTG